MLIAGVTANRKTNTKIKTISIQERNPRNISFQIVNDYVNQDKAEIKATKSYQIAFNLLRILEQSILRGFFDTFIVENGMWSVCTR